MDPVTIGAVLLAILSGTTEVLGSHLWAGVVSLVRRPRRGGAATHGSGEAELVALQQAPADQGKAEALARSLLARAAADAGFDQALRQWWQQAEPVRAGIGNVTNTISDGTQLGPVLQGRDFTGITFGAAAVPPPNSAPPA